MKYFLEFLAVSVQLMQVETQLKIYQCLKDLKTKIILNIDCSRRNTTKICKISSNHTERKSQENVYINPWIKFWDTQNWMLLLIGLGVRVFINGPGDLGSIPGRVIPKTQKMELDASLLNTQHYKVRIKGKVKQSREGVAPSPTPRCSSYRKGSLRVTLDYGRQLYLLTYDS